MKVNLLFCLYFLFFSQKLIIHTTKLNNFLHVNCFRYGSNSDLDKLGTNDESVKFKNIDLNKEITISQFNSKQECEKICSKNHYYYSCSETNDSYDKDFGLLKNKWVCWLKEKCRERSHAHKEFQNRDKNIKHKSKDSCDYMCNTVYMKLSHCIINKDFIYYCYYRNKKEEDEFNERKNIEKISEEVKKLNK